MSILIQFLHTDQRLELWPRWISHSELKLGHSYLHEHLKMKYITYIYILFGIP